MVEDGDAPPIRIGSTPVNVSDSTRLSGCGGRRLPRFRQWQSFDAPTVVVVLRCTGGHCSSSMHRRSRLGSQDIHGLTPGPTDMDTGGRTTSGGSVQPRAWTGSYDGQRVSQVDGRDDRTDGDGREPPLSAMPTGSSERLRPPWGRYGLLGIGAASWTRADRSGWWQGSTSRSSITMGSSGGSRFYTNGPLVRRVDVPPGSCRPSPLQVHPLGGPRLCARVRYGGRSTPRRPSNGSVSPPRERSGTTRDARALLEQWIPPFLSGPAPPARRSTEKSSVD